MAYLEIDHFRAFPEGALARCRGDVVIIREDGKRLGALIDPDLFDLYRLYEEEHWKRPADERPRLPETRRR